MGWNLAPSSSFAHAYSPYGQAIFLDRITHMSVQEFIRKWTDNKRSEKSASQEQFLDVCRLFEHATPNEDQLARNSLSRRGRSASADDTAASGALTILTSVF
jgi:hypothetical protein